MKIIQVGGKGMKRRELEYNLRIEEAWYLYEQDKMAQGIEVGYGEIAKFLNATDLCESDYISIISPDVINKYVIEMRLGKLSVGSINHYLRAVKAFLYWCMDQGFVSPFKIKMVKGQEERIKFADDEEIKMLLTVINHNDFVEMRTYTIICFILATGARSSTVRNIKIEDIDFKNHSVTYRHLKNKKVAVIPLTTQIERILHGFIRTWDTQSEFLFCDVKGGQLSEGALKLSFAHYCKKRGMRVIYPHALRHSFARMFIKNGGNAFVLQQMLTHSTLDMTRRYVRLFSDDIRDNDFESYNPLSVLSNPKSRTKVVRKNVRV